MADEIERKFLVKTTEVLASLTGYAIRQSYLERHTVTFVPGSSVPGHVRTSSLLLSASRQEIAYRIVVPEADSQGLQALLSSDDVTVRIRIKAQKALLTLKGKTEGISRPEFEYEILRDVAQACLAGPYVLRGLIEKTRYELTHAGRLFEVDVFEGKLAGLVLAEVELDDANAHVELPEWIGDEVSDDPRYFNSSLAAAGVVPTR